MSETSEHEEACAWADAGTAGMPPGEERDRLWDFLLFQYGGLKLIGERVRQHRPRAADTPRGGDTDE